MVSGSSNEMYDPEMDTWITKTPPPTSASFPDCVSAVFDNKIYVIGGLTADQSRVLNRIYDTETDTWNYGSSPPSSLGGGEAVVTTGVFAPELIYFIGYSVSLRQGEDVVFVRVYNPRTDTWTFGEDPPTKRWDFDAAVLNDTIYIIGGHNHEWIPGNFNPLTENEQYTPIGYIPEFPSWIVVPLFLATTAVAIAAKKFLTKFR